jgi:hypothetical protein
MALHFGKLRRAAQWQGVKISSGILSSDKNKYPNSSSASDWTIKKTEAITSWWHPIRTNSVRCDAMSLDRDVNSITPLCSYYWSTKNLLKHVQGSPWHCILENQTARDWQITKIISTCSTSDWLLSKIFKHAYYSWWHPIRTNCVRCDAVIGLRCEFNPI